MLGKKDKGFTLVEILVTAAISMILLGAIYMAVNSAQRHSMSIERKVTAQQDVRPALELMAMEIRMASFNPTFATGIWLNPADCASVSGNQQYRGIQSATPTSISIEMDIGPNTPSSAIGDDANEIITYTYLSDTANLRVTRSTSCGAAQSFLGDAAASGNPRTVRVINSDLNLPVFRYYAGDGTLIPAANLPAGIPDIRRIEITLAVQTEDIDPNTGQRRNLIYSTSVIPRNHN